MLSHKYAYRSSLETSQRINWTIDEVVGGRTFDFGKPLPARGARRNGGHPLSRSERGREAQAQPHSQPQLPGAVRLIEEYILPSLIEDAGEAVHGNDHEMRAILHFAEEEAKHIQLFKWFPKAFDEGFGTPCGIIGPTKEIVDAILSHSRLGVFLATLHIEWLTQKHYVESVKDNADERLDALFCSPLRHHWLEESQHAKLDTLVVDKIASDLRPGEIEKGIDRRHGHRQAPRRRGSCPSSARGAAPVRRLVEHRLHRSACRRPCLRITPPRRSRSGSDARSQPPARCTCRLQRAVSQLTRHPPHQPNVRQLPSRRRRATVWIFGRDGARTAQTLRAKRKDVRALRDGLRAPPKSPTRIKPHAWYDQCSRGAHMRLMAISLPVMMALLAPLAGASGCGSSQSSTGQDGGSTDAASFDAPTGPDAPGVPDGGGVNPDGGPWGGPVSVPTGSPITLSGRATDGSVSGTYKDPRTQLSFSFSIRATGETSARASFTLDTVEVQVSLSGPSAATITMSESGTDLGVVITGYGPMPTDIESQIVLGIIGGVFGPAIRAIPLELNCGTGFMPAELAALLVPWQVVYKYQLGPSTRYDDVRAAAEAATCVTFAFAGASPTQPPRPLTKPSGAGLVNLGNDDDLPTVFGFFPLDGAGSNETDGSAAMRALPISTKYGPCNSMCRGACGADCEPNNCNSATGLSQCEVDSTGANTCFRLVYTDYTCKTHPACIAHDDCYDDCNETWGCGSFYANVCMHAVGHAEPGFVSCDQRVADEYGAGQGIEWARGYGPHTATEIYRYVSSREWNATACPCNQQCVPGGTLVTLANGSSMPIEQGQEGDVIATLGPSGELSSAVVQKVLVHRDGPFLLDRLESSGGSELLVTPNHPVWTVELGYVPASELVVGAHVLVLDPASGSARAEKIVSIVRAFSTTDVVYNLMTSRSSYVAAGILVHNKCVARGSLVDTPAGAVPIESLRPGDRVYGQVDGRRVATEILRTYEKTTILGRLPGRRLAARLLVTENHRIVTPDGDKEASRLPVAMEDVVGVVYDLETESGNYWAQGALLRAASSSTTW